MDITLLCNDCNNITVTTVANLIARSVIRNEIAAKCQNCGSSKTNVEPHPTPTKTISQWVSIKSLAEATKVEPPSPEPVVVAADEKEHIRVAPGKGEMAKCVGEQKDCRYYRESQYTYRCMYYRVIMEGCDKIIIDGREIN